MKFDFWNSIAELKPAVLIEVPHCGFWFPDSRSVGVPNPEDLGANRVICRKLSSSRRQTDTIVAKMFAKWTFRSDYFPNLAIMPDRITVRSFLNEAREDVSSPTTSNFMSTMNACRNTVGALEEVRYTV